MATTPAGAALLLEAIAGVDADDPATVDDAARRRPGRARPRPRRPRRRALRRPAARPARARRPRGLRQRRARARGGRRAPRRGRRCPRPSCPSGVPDDPERRGARHAPAGGPLPGRRDEYGADVLGRLDAASEVTVGAVPAGERRPRARPRRLRPPLPLVRRAADAGQRGLAGPDRGGDLVHEGEELTFRDLVMSYTTPQDLVGLPACAVRAGFDALGVPVGVQFTGRALGRSARPAGCQGLFDATPEVQSRRPPLWRRAVSDRVICYNPRFRGVENGC